MSKDMHEVVLRATLELPEEAQELLSKEFQVLLIALNAHGFSVSNIIEGKKVLTDEDVENEEYGYPFVIVESDILQPLYRDLSVPPLENPDYERLTRKAAIQNLHIQEKLLVLLDKFYRTHTPRSALARLALNRFRGSNESLLEPQGVYVRPIKDEAMQAKIYDDFHAEMCDFGRFLVDELEVSERLQNKTTPA